MSTAAAAELALLDTNLLVYGVDEESEFHAASRGLLLRAGDAAAEERLCAAPRVLAKPSEPAETGTLILTNLR